MCPGYYDPKSIIFRDETTTVLTKAFRRQELSVPSALFEPLEDRAKHLFISRHVFGDYPVLSYMKVLYPLNLTEHAHLMATIRAVSMAYLAKEVHSSSILQEARKKYSSALLLTKQSLQEPRAASQNTTLLNVLLLDLFENLTAERGRGGAETGHLDGALALMKLRGDHLFKDPLGVAIFMHLGSNILSNCLKNEVMVPVDFIQLRCQAKKYIDENEFEWQVSELMIQIADFQSAQRAATMSELGIVSVLRRLRQKLELIMLSSESFGISSGMLAQNDARSKNDVCLLRRLLNEVTTSG